MPDEIDLAQRAEELFLENNLKQVQLAAGARKLQPKGECHFCGEKLDPVMEGGQPVHKRLYCDNLCAEDHEKEQRSRERTGR